MKMVKSDVLQREVRQCKLTVYVVTKRNLISKNVKEKNNGRNNICTKIKITTPKQLKLLF